MQTKFTGIALLIPMCIGIVTDAFLPLVGIQMFHLATTSTTAMAILIAYAMQRYQLMSPTVVELAESLVNITNEPFIIISPDGTIKAINPVLGKLLGYNEEELKGKPLMVIFAGHVHFKGKRLEELIKEELLIDYECIFLTKNGKEIPVSFSSSLMKDGEGELVGVIGIAQDMRETRLLIQKERELAEADREKAAVIEGMIDIVGISDMGGRITQINEAVEAWGYRKEELIGKPVAEVIAKRSLPKLEEGRKISLETEFMKNLELVGLKKDGGEFPVLVNVSLMKDAEGKPTGHIFALRDITELRQAENLILQTQQKYMSLVNNLNVGIYRRRPDGRFIEVNPALVSILEADSKEDAMLNHHASDTHLDPQKYEEINKKILKFGYIKDEEVELVTYKGNKFWASVTAAANKDKEGNIYFDGVLYDITERKKVEKTLKESEEHARIFAAYQHAISELRKFYIVDATFEQIVQKTLDLFVEEFGYYMTWYAELIEEEKVILPKLWAGKYEKYLDGLRLEFESDKRDAKCAMSIAILTKKPFGYADLEHDKDFEKWRAFALQYGYRSNQAIPFIVDGKCKSAFLIYSTRPFAFSEKPVEYLKGIIDELATVIENITELKRAREREKELAEAVAVADIEKKRAEELEKSQDASLNIMEDLDRRRKELEDALKKLRETQTKLVQSEELSTALKELRKTQDELAQSEKLASVGQLAAGVAHEINNPLASILLGAQRMSDMIKKQVKAIPDFKVYLRNLERMEESTNRCKKIVAGLLAFSRPTKIELGPTDINKVIEETLEPLEEQVKAQDVRVIRGFAPSLPIIEADGQQLSQVFNNLIMNACGAMPKGGQLRIITRLQTPEGGVQSDASGEVGKTVEIEFSDTGGGIPEEDMLRIFDPFFTTKEVGKGVGLGLSISYAIVEEHGGTIEVRSEKGKGTTFIVRLPVKI